MKPILALETSTSICGVAIYSADHAVEMLYDQEIEGVAGHARRILPLVEEVMHQAGVERSALRAVAFGHGPGGFTGVRLGCSVAQGMAYALGIPVVQVGALPALAHASRQQAADGIRLVALDARMNEMYLAAYGPEQGASLQSPTGMELQLPVLLRASDCERFVAARLPYWLRAAGGAHQLTLVGQGWDLVNVETLTSNWRQFCPELVVQRDNAVMLPHVADIARLAYKLLDSGLYVDPAMALPLYLRDKVAFTSQERAQGQGGNPQASQTQDLLLLPMSLADVPEVVDLEQRSQAFPWTEQHFVDSLKAGYPGWVLRRSEQLLGFCVGMVAPDEVHLLVIAVEPDVRTQGLGRQLLEQLYKSAHQIGASRVLLEVRPSNEIAIAFYQHQGFETIGIRRGYYPAAQGQREDACVMARDLHGERAIHG